MAECKACGHRDTQHANFGCNQGFCKCEMSNQDVIDSDKLAALRKAGEKMAERLRRIDKSSPMLNAAALAEWEAANK